MRKSEFGEPGEFQGVIDGEGRECGGHGLLEDPDFGGEAIFQNFYKKQVEGLFLLVGWTYSNRNSNEGSKEQAGKKHGILSIYFAGQVQSNRKYLA